MESLIIGAVVLALCLLGIQTRLIFSLASIWPANAALLGILLVRPQANRPLTWLAAATGYVLADLLTGSALEKAVALNAVNLIGIGCGLLFAQTLGLQGQALNRPLDAIRAIMVMTIASIAAGIAGGLVGIVLFDMPWLPGFGLWFAAEFVNYAIFLPLALTLRSDDPDRFRFFSRQPLHRPQQLAAIGTLLLSACAMHLLGGPGASSYVAPGMLWCAVCFRPFASVVLAMLTCTWILVAGPLDYIPLKIDMLSTTDALSFRLGVGMLAVGTFAVTIINMAWRRTTAELRHLATHDALTNLDNRRAFMEKLSTRMAATNRGKLSLLMIDVDRFKLINDSYGHPAGDAVLQALARLLLDISGPGVVAGRLGGEEFAVMVDGALSGCPMQLARRIQDDVRKLTVVTDNGTTIKLTVSIGAAECRPEDDRSSLLTASDSALYAAKHGGRDRTVWVTPSILDMRAVALSAI